MNPLILADIASAVATLLGNPLFGHDAEKLTGIAGLISLAFQVTGMNDQDRQLLLAQVQQANAENRVLSEAEMAVWHARHEAAKKAIQDWKP